MKLRSFVSLRALHDSDFAVFSKVYLRCVNVKMLMSITLDLDS